MGDSEITNYGMGSLEKRRGDGATWRLSGLAVVFPFHHKDARTRRTTGRWGDGETGRWGDLAT